MNAIRIPALLSLLMLAPLAMAGEPGYVQVQAAGEIQANPDFLRLRLQVSDTRSSLGDAKSSVDKAMNQLLKTCQQLGIADKDIDAATIRSYPQYEWSSKGSRQYRGEQVVRPVTVTLRQMDKYSDLVHRLMQNDLVQIDNTEMDFNDRDALQQQALRKALLAARSKATLMAETLDRHLGQVQFITESGSSMPQPMYQMRAMAAEAKMASPAPMMVQEQTISASVEVRFELE